MIHRIGLQLLLALIAGLALTACNATFDVQTTDQYSDITLRMSEADVQALANDLLDAGNSSVQSIDVDLRPGTIFIEGELGETPEATMNAQLAVQLTTTPNGDVRATMTLLSILGFQTGATELAHLNRDIADSINAAVADSRDQNRITAIAITDHNLAITLRSFR
ncbi:MAG: hypothetical protein AAF787_19925 [Chloroflexota bacterium]